MSADLIIYDESECEVLARDYGLTLQELMFVKDYVAHFDLGRSFINNYSYPELKVLAEADFKSAVILPASKILARPEIMAAITREIQAIGEKLFLKKEAVLARVWMEALSEKAKPAERLKALELAAKMIGAMENFEPPDVKPQVNVYINNGGMNPKVSAEVTEGNVISKQEVEVIGDQIEMGPITKEIKDVVA